MANLTKMALDVVDWHRLWGTNPVTFEQWHNRLCPQIHADYAKRTWLRRRKRLEREGYPIKVLRSDRNPAAYDVALCRGALTMAENYLDNREAEREARCAEKEQQRQMAAAC